MTLPRCGFPGAGGAPEIAANCGEVIITLPHSRRAFVEQLDFVTSLGHGNWQRKAASSWVCGAGDRRR